MEKGHTFTGTKGKTNTPLEADIDKYSLPS